MSMKPVAGTLPEPKLQSIKKKRAPKLPPAIPVAPDPATTASRGEARAKTRRPSDLIGTYWPMLVAVFISGFAPEWHAMAVSAGIWALRFTFPYTLLATLVDPHMLTIVPNAAIYLQIPIDGAYVSFTLARGKSLMSGIVQVLIIHGACTLLLALLTYA